MNPMQNLMNPMQYLMNLMQYPCNAFHAISNEYHAISNDLHAIFTNFRAVRDGPYAKSNDFFTYLMSAKQYILHTWLPCMQYHYSDNLI